MSSDRAAIVQGDRSVLLEVDHPGYDEARLVLARFAELEKSPEHVHTYRLGDLALWNAAAAGASVEHEIRDRMARHGVCSLHDHPSDPALLRVAVREPFVRDRLAGDERAAAILRPAPDGFVIDVAHRGMVKQALLAIGYPVDDRAGLAPGDPLPIAVRTEGSDLETGESRSYPLATVIACRPA